MPIYEYQCTRCEKRFEKLMFRGEEAEVSCPGCKSKEVEKLLSATSFITGSGISSRGGEGLKGTS